MRGCIVLRGLAGGPASRRSELEVEDADALDAALRHRDEGAGRLLVVEDKLSMAHGLEARVPFLDNDLVDFASRIPAHMKLGQLGRVDPLNENDIGPKSDQYFRRTGDGKLILRKALSRYVPAEITHRKKQGFSAPDASWFRGESIDFVRKTLYGRNVRLYDVLDRGAIQNLLDDHLEGRTNRRLLIWSLLSLEHWLREFVS